MFRTTAARSLRNNFTRLSTVRSIYSVSTVRTNNGAFRPQMSNRRPQVLASLPRPTTTSLLYATKNHPYDNIDPEAEKKVLKKPITAHPEQVSSGSSVRHVFEEGQGPKADQDEMVGSIRADVKTIKETFALTEVPRESLVIGAAGVLPYAATSLSTVYLAWDINQATSGTGTGVLFNPELAHQLLEWVTPIQIGYGAVIISFLGAIHWGLEYAGYGGYHGYSRYMYGVIAPAVAWPTMFMPVEYALITQFAAFNFLYFADARATVKGWFPAWYSTYRFVLTFFVGASIVISLVGRGQITTREHSAMKGPVDYLKGVQDSQWVALEQEEKERREKLAKEEEEESDDEEGKDEGEEGDEGKKADKDDEKDDNKDGDDGTKKDKK